MVLLTCPWTVAMVAWGAALGHDEAPQEGAPGFLSDA